MSDEDAEYWRDRLKQSGIRATEPRLAVLRLLADSERPLSHTEVVQALASSPWDQATLYRNLLRLAESGLARVVSRIEGVARYQALVDDGAAAKHLHPHFACTECGAVACLPDSTLSLPRETAWRNAVAEAELQVVGRCPRCRTQALA